jgi:two-component system CheB/CheR fusion protein
VDASLDPEAIAQQLHELAQLELLREAPAPAGHGEDEDAPAGDLTRIFHLLRLHTGVDFALYKRSTMQRRIARRMVLHRMSKPDEYAKLLRSKPEEIDALFDDLLINVTSFFRDKAVFQVLSRKIFPRIIKNRASDDSEIRIWVPGCATGEEVYSLAITMTECLRKARCNARVQIFGTDLSEAAITKARIGIFSPTAVANVSPEWLRRYFSKINDHYQINRTIRDLCTFARQNVPQDPPFSRLDLISCRNVLIYLGRELQRRCLPIFHYSLNPGGYLLLGTAETVGGFGELFTLEDKRCKIYQRRLSSGRPDVEFGTRTPLHPGVPKAPLRSLREHDLQAEIQREADRVVLSRMAPSGVVINTNLQVLQFRGATGMYLEHATGEASLNLLQLVRPALAIDLRAAIHNAIKQDAPTRCEDIFLPHNGHGKLVTIEVLPFRVLASANECWLLVLFSNRPAVSVPGAVKAARGVRTDEGQRLREELRATKESLQAIIEEQEATNEELKSANEEIESSNEELQSSNEELETAKEELQSTNEELQTLNEELNTRNQEMAQINSDLQNLLSSINLPIVMVDNALAIRRVTPQAERLFNVMPSDVGRRLSDFKPNLRLNAIDALIRKVIDSLETYESEVLDEEGRMYSMRIRPYRTRENKIDGAVVTFLDIGAIKRAAAAAGILDELLDVPRRPHGLVVLDAAQHVLLVNRQFRAMFRLGKRELAGKTLTSLKVAPWDGKEARELFEKTLPRERTVRTLPLRYRARSGPARILVTACCLGGEPSDLFVVSVAEETREHSGKA